MIWRLGEVLAIDVLTLGGPAYSMRLAAKLIATLVFAISLILLVDGTISAQREFLLLENDVRQRATVFGRTLAKLLSDEWASGGRRRIERLVGEINGADEGLRARLVVLADDKSGKSSPGGPGLITIRVSLSELESGLALELSEPVAPLEQRRRRALIKILVLTGLLVVLGIALILVLGLFMVGRPLERLLAKVRRMSGGDLEGPIALGTNDELAELGSALNEMCENLSRARETIREETDRRVQAVEQLRHGDRLRTAGSLAAGVAHELGTPLNVIGGRAGLIRSGRIDEDEIRRSAEVIKEQTTVMTQIVRGLLDFARRDAPRKRTVDLLEFAERCVALLEPLAWRREIALELKEETLSLAVSADGVQLQQALSNLILNAVQASPDGSRVSIETGLDEGPEPMAWVAVRDRGCGIEESAREKIFDPFYTTKEVGEGTGLGLSIAFGIIREHGGSLDLVSELGEGTCFTLRLPSVTP